MSKQRVPAPLHDLTHQLSALLKALPQLPALWHRTQQHAPGIAAVAYDSEGGSSSGTSSPTERQAFQRQRDDHLELRRAIDQTCGGIATILNILGRNPVLTTAMVASNFCDYCHGQLSQIGRCTKCGKHEDTKLCANPQCADPIENGSRLARCKPCYLIHRTTGRERITTRSLLSPGQVG